MNLNFTILDELHYLFDDEALIITSNKNALKELLRWCKHQNAFNHVPLTGNEPALDDLQMQLQFISSFLETLDECDRSHYYLQLSELLTTDAMNVQLITIWAAIIDDWDILQNCAYAYHTISNLIDLKKDWTINDAKAINASRLINNV
jgi:hypothetical protein